MYYVCMQKMDLNLLAVLDAVITEQSITAAADRLGMTQPAVSNAVARMRSVWNDPLFVKEGRGVKPTPRALSLWDDTHSHLSAIRQSAFETSTAPADLTRGFRIGITDMMQDMIWLPLFRKLQIAAPWVKLYAVPLLRTVPDMLNDGDVDFVVDLVSKNSKQIRSEWIFDNEMVCAVRAGHPLSRKPLTMERYLAAKHLMVTISGATSGNIDTLLARKQLSREMTATVLSFSAIAPLLIGTDLITVTPRITIAEALRAEKLVTLDLPFQISHPQIGLSWHTRGNRDQSAVWFRNLLADFVRNQAAELSSVPK